jgi:hypothetical protein
LSFQASQAVPKRWPSSAHAFYFQVVTFKKGSSEISKVDKDALDALIQAVKDHSQKIEQAHVAVWSDRRPAEKSVSSIGDRAIAEKRIVAIEDHLEGPLGLSNVESYNMAERTNWFARAFNANSHDVKSMFAQKGAPQNVTPEDFQIVKSKAAASRAVILFELDPTATTVADPVADPAAEPKN